MVLDPFCGFGTSVVTAQAIGRVGIGIEQDEERFQFASATVKAPSRVIHGSAGDVGQLGLPQADLVFTSPPYTSFRAWSEEGFANYWANFEAIFAGLRGLMKPKGRLVVELSNVREADGTVRTVAFEGAALLARHYEFEGEFVRCTTGDEPAGPGFNHAYLFVYGKKHA